jgi:hypothetical protein
MNVNDKSRDHATGPIRSLLAATLVGCCLVATSPAADAQGREQAPMTNSKASFVAWHQGFEHGTAGWYDAATPGPLGWCGAIESVDSRAGGAKALAPSAGRGYATVSLGFCNEFWAGLGVPFGAPYGPGPDLALYSSAWPVSGYVTELDIYLDPAWSGDFRGSFQFAGSSPDALVQYAATIFPTDPDAEPFHTGPHYFVEVEAVPGEEALTVARERIDTAGWYTFRFAFRDAAGRVRVDFELAERNGRVLAVIEDVAPVELLGPVKVPFEKEPPTAEYGSGHVWFFDVAYGLELPIDEHRVRRGR